jgi:hypothetical protein
MLKVRVLLVLLILSILVVPTKISTEEIANDISKTYEKNNIYLNNFYKSEHNDSKYNIYENLKDNGDVFFTSPYNNDIFRAGDLIYINGTIKGKRFKNYVIEYGRGIDPVEWESMGISLVNNGKSPVLNSTIATWDTSHISEPDFYTLRFKVVYRGFSRLNFLNPLFRLFSYLCKNDHEYDVLKIEKTYYVKNIYLDPTLRDGWPVRLNWDINENVGCYVWSGKVEPVVSDVDNDGMMEIFVIVQATPFSIVYGFETDGSFVDGWPIEILDDYSVSDPRPTIITPTVIDLDNDGYHEVIIGSFTGIKIYNYNGTLRKEIELKLSNQPSIETVVFDLDNDGDFEFIKLYDKYREEGEYIAVMDHNGNLLDNWPQMYYNFSRPGGGVSSVSAVYEAAPAVGNFDDDPEMEIVVASGRNVFDDPENPQYTHHVEGRIYVYNIDGSVLDGFPVDVDGWIYRSPAVGDINNDGYDEIIVGSRYFGTEYGGLNYGLFAIDRFGNFCNGWPQLIGEGYGIVHHPALADFNGDGFLEIVAGTVDQYDDTGHHIYVFNYKGEVLPGWPKETTWISPVSPIIADITDDGVPDIILVAGGSVFPGYLGEGGVYAWNIDGSLIDGFPKIIEWPYATVTIADIDQDGMVELIGSSGDDMIDFETMEYKHRSSIYVWELNCLFNESTLEWPMYHHDNHYSGWYHFEK